VRAILTYHSIDPSGSPISLERECFERHLRFFASGRVQVVPLARILDAPPESDVAALTFDDGFANFETQAWPLLCELGLPATLFVVTGRAGSDNSWSGAGSSRVPTLPLMGWDTLARLAQEGLELGAHSRTHPHLEKLSDQAQLEEVEGSAADLQARTGQRPQSFCFPYGTFDARAAELARRIYARACTTELRALGERESPHLLPRLDAFYYRSRGRLESWGSPGFRCHLWTRGLARKARRALQA
jgi:peptidoglycan/xylan/chitin deacetylase (PgdA/CDA1 family)